MDSKIYICDFCNKKYDTKLALSCHKIRCKQNPNRKIWNSWKPSSCWNKGLTKETDIRIKIASENFNKKFAEGKIKIKGHPHSKETKEILSKKRSEYLASAKNAGGFKDIGWYEV